MEDFLRFAGLAAFIGALIYYQARKERDAHWEEVEERIDNAPEISTEHNFEVRDETEQDKPNIDDMAQKEQQPGQDKITTAVLEKLYDMLLQRGCKPSVGMKNQLVFSYQGEMFTADVDGYYLRLIDPWWVILDIDDSRIGAICKIANMTNIRYFGPDITWTTDDSDRTFGLHTKQDWLVSPAFPDFEGYFYACLDLFFDKKRNFFKELDRAKVPADDSPQYDSSNKGTPPVDFNDLCMN